jgi:hypothetical protein
MSESLLPPLVPADVDLRDFGFMPLDVLRLRDSDLAALAGGDAFKAAVLLWCVAWHQVPAASLPKDDRLLARHSGAGTSWRKVKEEALRGFVECSDGRLYHATIAEKAREAWAAKATQRARTAAATAAREAKRREQQAERDGQRNEPRNGERDEQRDVERNVVQGTGTGTGTGTVKGQGQGTEKKTPRKRAEPESVVPEMLSAFGFTRFEAVEFIAHKQRLKAPLTHRAWLDHCAEAGKAGWTPKQAAEKVMAKGWKGFEAKYVEHRGPNGSSPRPAQQTTAERNAEAKRLLGFETKEPHDA